jgi:hypothetical protein
MGPTPLLYRIPTFVWVVGTGVPAGWVQPAVSSNKAMAISVITGIFIVFIRGTMSSE